MFQDLSEDVAELFADEQIRYERAVVKDAFFQPFGEPGHNKGYRFFSPNPISTPEFRASKAAFKRKYDLADIRERLLRGERPKMTRRIPSRWLKVAATLGIVLVPPPKKPKLPPKETRYSRQIRERLLAGERWPDLARRAVPRVWREVAKELGIDLDSPAPGDEATSAA